MRLTDIDCQLYRVPAPVVLKDAIQTISHWEWVLVRIDTDAGVSGTGFSYTLGIGGSALCTLIRDYLAPLVVGADLDDYDAIWDRCWRAQHANGGAGFSTLAIAPIDIAIHDARARKANRPLYEELGARADRVPIYASGINLHLSREELVDQVDRYVGLGYNAIKIKVGRPDFDDDVERVEAVRRRIGPERLLLLDANQSWAVDEAITRITRLERFEPVWIEEPCLADEVEGNRRVRAAVGTPIALGETLFNRYEFRMHMDIGAADILQPDVARVGGFTEWMKIAMEANARNLPIAPHFVMELAIHGLCAIPNGRFLENVEGGSLYELGLAREPLRIESGYAYPPDAPGHGIDFDQSALKRWLVDGADMEGGVKAANRRILGADAGTD